MRGELQGFKASSAPRLLVEVPLADESVAGVRPSVHLLPSLHVSKPPSKVFFKGEMLASWEPGGRAGAMGRLGESRTSEKEEGR